MKMWKVLAWNLMDLDVSTYIMPMSFLDYIGLILWTTTLKCFILFDDRAEKLDCILNWIVYDRDEKDCYHCFLSLLMKVIFLN
jgi:hypothetical protein